MSDSTLHVAELSDDYVHGLLSDEKAAEVERHCAECEPCRTALEQARGRFEALRSVPPEEPSPQLVEKTVEAVQRRRAAVKRVFKWLTGSAAAAALALTVLSAYYQHLKPTPYDLVVLGQTDLILTSMASMRVRLMNHDTQGPVEGVPVSMTLQAVAQPGPPTEFAGFKTDGNGVGQPRFTVPELPEGDYDLTVKADVSGPPEIIKQRVRLIRSWRLLLSSDKPVYQPGQVIHMRALALRQPNGQPVAATAATFTVTDPKGNIVFKQSGDTSAFGITAADCALADELIEGRYTLTCRVGETESRVPVSVFKYVLPRIKVAAEFDRPYYQPTDRAKCTIRADYFFGKPVADAEVRVEVRCGSDALPPETIPVARTGLSGAVVLNLSLPELLQKRARSSPETMFSFHVTVTDSAGQKQTADLDRLVTLRPVRIEVIPEGGILVPGVPNKVYLLTTTPDGKPTSVALHVSGEIEEEIRTNDLGLASVSLNPTESPSVLTLEAFGDDGETLAEETARLRVGDQRDDFLLTTDRAVYRAGDTMKLSVRGGGADPVFVDFMKLDGVQRTVLSDTIRIVKDGRGDSQLDLPHDLNGPLLLCAYRLGAGDSRLQKTHVVYVQPADQLQVKLAPASAQKEYRPRAVEKVHLTLTDAAGKPTAGAFSVAAVDEAVFAVQSGAAPITGLDNALLRPVFAGYSWKPSLPRGPGREDINELERALFSRTATPRFDDNYRDRPFSYPALQPSWGDTYPDKVKAAEERQTLWRGKLHSGWLTWLIAVSVLCYAGVWIFVNTAEVKRLHQGVLMVLGPFAFIIFVYMMSGTIGHDSSNTFTYVSGQVKGGSSTAKGPLLEDHDEGRLRLGTRTGSYSGENTTISQAGTSTLTLNGVMAGQAEDLVPFIREQFPETLLWRPEIITDDQGRASVDLTFADSITTWRLSALAVDAGGRLGSGELPLRVVRPFFVDFDLPVSLTRNDEVSVPVVVHNYTDKPQTVTLTLSEADWFTRSGGPEKALVVEPGKVAAVRYRLTARKAGTFTLEVRADGQGVSDALKRNIEIVPDGVRVEMPPANGSLDRPAGISLVVPDGVIDGSVRAQVKIYPTSFSQLLEGLDGIFRLPSGCFEQTSSSTYPNVLALDYLRRTRQSRPEIEAKAKRYIHAGYQRLLSFEQPDGGFEWFGHGSASRTLTAYGLMEFTDMARVYNVDPKLIERTRSWLLRQRHNGSWEPDGHDPGRGSDSRLTATAYIAWAVFDNGAAVESAKPTLDYLLRRKPATIQDAYVLALVSNALLALDPTGAAATPYLDRLETLKKTAARAAWWSRAVDQRTIFYAAGKSADVETTALAALALLRAQRPASTAAALSWLASQKDAYGTWGSTQATVLSLKALLAGTHAAGGEERERVIDVKLSGKLLKTLTIPPDQAEVMQSFDLTPHLAAGKQRLTLTEKSGTASGYQVALRYHVEKSKVEPGPADTSLGIELTHERTEVNLLDVVGVKARVVNRMPAAAAMVMLELPVPPGFAPLTDALQAMQNDGKIAKFTVEPRKIVVYLRELQRDQPLEVKYRLQALQSVKALSQGARVWEYYSPEREAKTAPVVLTVRETRQ